MARHVLVFKVVAVAALAFLMVNRPARATAYPLLAAAGDISCRPGSVPKPNECGGSATGAEINRAHPTVVAALGDNQYEYGTLAEFLAPGAFNETWGAFKSRIRPVPGNHEYTISPTASGYFDYFGVAAGPDARGYYSYQLGAWHLIALNSSCASTGCGDTKLGRTTTAQLRWLKSDLAHTRARCILAYWHHPLFSSTVGLNNELGVAPLWRILFDAKADVVLNGHAHDYERFARQDPDGQPTPRGIREFVVGTGGRNHGQLALTHVRTSQVRDGDEFGALFMTLHKGSYSWEFRNVEGVLRDHGSTRCHSASRAA
jgi:acid phosphatase type 7